VGGLRRVRVGGGAWWRADARAKAGMAARQGGKAGLELGNEAGAGRAKWGAGRKNGGGIFLC
jgi:hypothetical protein